MVWYSVHLFSVCEKRSVHSRVNGLHSSCSLHGSYGCALHCAKYGSDAHVLYLVEFVRVGLGCCSPRTCIQALVALSQCTLSLECEVTPPPSPVCTREPLQ